MKALSMDIRARVVEARQEGQSSAEVAKRFKTSIRTVDRYWKKYRETGQFAPGQHGGHRVSQLKEHDEVLLGWIEKEPDLTILELRQRLKRRLKITIGKTALEFRLKKLGLSYKKNATGGRTRTLRHSGPPPVVESSAAALGGPSAGVH